MPVDLLEALMPTLILLGLGIAAVVPWILMAMIFMLNPNAWIEFKSVFNKKAVRVIDFLHNGQIKQSLKNMGKDRRIEITKSSKGDQLIEEILTPTNPPNFEQGGRKVFCRLQGSDNNFNPAVSNVAVTDPMRQMYGSMRFEDGRRYERRMFLDTKDPNMKLYILFIAVILVMIAVLGMQFAGNSMLQNIVDMAKSATGQLASNAAGA